jgi:ERCC4-type nuclease
MIQFLVDYREQKMLDLLNLDHVQVKPLLLGDFYIFDEEHEIIVERKTWLDLRASIHDSRYREQRSRLLLWKEEKNNRQVIYIIEGTDEKDHVVEKNLCFRLMIGYSLPVFFTSGIEETKNRLHDIYQQDSLHVFFKTRLLEQDQLESRLSGVRKKNYEDKKLFLLETISSLRGVSYEIAFAIGGCFDGLVHLCTELSKDPDAFFSQISKLEYKTNKGTTKKIPKHVIEKIKKNFGS